MSTQHKRAIQVLPAGCVVGVISGQAKAAACAREDGSAIQLHKFDALHEMLSVAIYSKLPKAHTTNVETAAADEPDSPQSPASSELQGWMSNIETEISDIETNVEDDKSALDR